jgi:DNA-binding CsgD family transcriptional regulator
MTRRPVRAAPPDFPLTDRQHQVLALIALGCKTAEICKRLYITENTFCTHLKRIFQKLGVQTRGGAIHRAWQLGLLPWALTTVNDTTRRTA